MEKNLFSKTVKSPKSPEGKGLPPETLKYLFELARKEKLLHSFEVINPSDVQLHEAKGAEAQLIEGMAHVHRYKYNTSIGGIEYVFFINTIDGTREEHPEYTKPENLQTTEFHYGRIDFEAEEGAYITNIGLKEIHKTDQLLKDLVRFVYAKNKAELLIVEASKSDMVLFPSSGNEAIARIKTELDAARTGGIIPNIIFRFEQNSKLEKLVLNDGMATIYYNNQSRAFLNFGELLDFLQLPELLEDPIVRKSIIKLLPQLIVKDSKKQEQRLALYERRLKHIGLDVERNGQKLYAHITEPLVNSLYNFSPESLHKGANEILAHYVAETGNDNPSVLDIQEWADKQK